MLSLVRTGPIILTISARSDPQELISALERCSSVLTTPVMESNSNVTEGDTLIFFSCEDSDEILTYQTAIPVASLLCKLINGGLAKDIIRIRTTPPNIFMRLMGNFDRAIDQIAIDFKAREAVSSNLLQNLDEQAVLVNFTSLPLNKLVPVSDYYPRALLIDKPFGQLLTFLRAKAQEYLSIAMGSPDWNEVAINLFDAMDQFNLHYQRLITVLQGLDIGVVVGESWEPEYTVAFRKSEVYQVRLVTPLDAQEIKRMSMALEYDDDGKRVVDFDVYFHGKKINWGSERKKLGGSRDQIGLTHRRRLLSRLPAEARGMLLRLEKQIDRSGVRKL